MEYSEITGAFFLHCVNGLSVNKVIQGEQYRKTYYVFNQVTLLHLENFNSCTSQYYVIDINA